MFLDLLPDRCDSDSVTMPPHRVRRTVFTVEQKATLEATFRNKKYLSREEKATLAAKLDLDIAKVQVCFVKIHCSLIQEGLNGVLPFKVNGCGFIFYDG